MTGKEPSRAMIFDLGNVLVKFDRDKANNRAAKELKTTRETIERALCDRTAFLAYERGEMTDEEFLDRLSLLLRETPAPPDRETLSRIFADIFEPDPDAIRLLENLSDRGVPLILLSNTNNIHYSFLEGRLPDLFERFDVLLLSYRLKLLKPDPAIYRMALGEAERLTGGVRPENVYYADDIEEYAEAAAKLGITSHRYTHAAALEAWLEANALLDGPFRGPDENS